MRHMMPNIRLFVVICTWFLMFLRCRPGLANLQPHAALCLVSCGSYVHNNRFFELLDAGTVHGKERQGLSRSVGLQVECGSGLFGRHAVSLIQTELEPAR